jgi:hypothetical protein
MLFFDTDTIEKRDRADAVSTSMLDATLSTDLVHHDPDNVWLRMAATRVGVVEFVHVDTSSMDTRRTSRQVASDEAPTVALSLGMGRRSAIEQDGDAIAGRLSALNLVELTRPYQSWIPRGTKGWSVKIPWTSSLCHLARSAEPGRASRPARCTRCSVSTCARWAARPAGSTWDYPVLCSGRRLWRSPEH